MKKLVSFLLVVTLLMSVCTPVLAVEKTDSQLQHKIYNVNDAIIDMVYEVDDRGYLSYVEICDDVIEFVDNKAYLNGELLATYATEIIDTNPNAVVPYTSWVYTSTCPYGSFSDYSDFYQTVRRNITLETVVAETSVNIIFTLLKAMVPWDDNTSAYDLFWDVAYEIYNGAQAYEDADKIYAKEHIYSHDTLPSAFHQNRFNFYSDSACTDYIDSATGYSMWA